MKKYRKKLFLNWKNITLGVILCNLAVCGYVFSAPGEVDSADDGVLTGVTVRVRPQDAKRLSELESLRREAEKAKEDLAKLELEAKALRESELRSRRELIDLTEKYQQQNEQYRQLRLVLSGALASGKVRGAGEREEQLLRAMSEVAVNGGELALKTVKFCELVEEMTRDLPIGKVKQTELQLKLDDLKRDSGRFITLTTAKADQEKALEKCRILAVNRELSIVVLPVGSVHGAFNGLTYYVGKDTAVLKVVSVRPFVAAAQLISGNIDALTPGMEAATQSK